MRVRIGNDIKLFLSLVEDENQPLNIISCEAFIVNRTAQKRAIEDIKKKTRFLSRFPMYNELSNFEPSEYNINIVGNLAYNCYPHRHNHHQHCGFGIYPNWDKFYTPIVDNCNLTSYKPQIKFTNQRNVISIMFPAEAQLYTGTYDIIVVAKTYAEGFSKDNLRTITVDYRDAFTLVSSSEEGDTGDITINIANGAYDEKDPNSYDIYVKSGKYEDESLKLNRSDGVEIDIPMNVENKMTWNSY